jgi:hypothetical protein
MGVRANGLHETRGAFARKDPSVAMQAENAGPPREDAWHPAHRFRNIAAWAAP